MSFSKGLSKIFHAYKHQRLESATRSSKPLTPCQEKREKVARRPTWSVLRVIEVDAEGMASVADDFGRVRVVLDAKRLEGSVVLCFLSFNLNRRLPIPVGNREKFFPANGTWNAWAQKERTEVTLPNKYSWSAADCAWDGRETNDEWD